MASWQESDDKPRQGVEKQRRYSANQVRIVKAIVFPMVKNGCESWTIKKAVQLLSCVRLFVTPWIAACQASLSITNSRACLNSCLSSQWCHPTISSSIVSFSSCLQSSPVSFPMNQFFTSGRQSIGVQLSKEYWKLEYWKMENWNTQSFQWIVRTDFL